jgi:hypothetical protein
MRLLCVLAVLSLALTSDSANAATTIDFDAFEEPGGGFVIHPNPLDLGAYRFTSVDFSSTPLLTTFQQGSPFYNGSAALSCGNASDIILTRIDGGAFDALSVDLDSWQGPDTIELTAELLGGGSVQQTFTTDVGVGGETVALSGFTDITSLRFEAAGGSPFAGIFGQIDNLLLATRSTELRDAQLVAGGSPVLQNGSGSVRLEDARLGPPNYVPEPSAVWQLGCGIGLLALLARRHSLSRRTRS